jgi:F0F1-type ATP synthase assembly protein I
MGQVGLEMVAPIGLGYFLDTRYGWSPWGVIVGVVVGLVGGIGHLVLMARQMEPPKRGGDRPPGQAPGQAPRRDQP